MNQEININVCYVIGTMLISKKEVSFQEIETTLRRLLMINPNYKFIGNPKDAIDEWKDFFRYKDDETIVIKGEKELFKMIFYDSLNIETVKDIEKVMKASK